MLIAAACVLFTFADYGMSWDEPYAVVYGRNALAFFTSLGADHSAAIGPVTLRGPLFQLLVEALASFVPEHGLLVRRLLTPLVGLLGVAGCWQLSRLVAGSAAGALAAALLLLTPIYYGHMFINPADLPFAVAYVWGLYFAARLIMSLPRVDWRALLGAALSLGFGASMRIGGVLLLAITLALLALRAYAPLRARDRGALLALLVPARVWLPALCALAYLALLASWPAALLDPLHVPWAAARQALAFPKHEPVLLAGDVYWSDALPRYYQLAYLLVQLPEQLTIAALAGGALLLQRLRTSAASATAVPAAASLLGVLAPLAGACVLRPNDYDGMRHILFAVPPLVCIAAAGVVELLRRLRPRPWACALLVALLAGSAARTLSAMVELHPYEYVYYNPSAGGTRGAKDRWELDYWITSFGEALHGLGEALAQQTPPGAPPARHRLIVCGHAAVAYMYLPPGVELTRNLADADYVLATTKWSCDRKFQGKVVTSVERAGVALSVVKRVQLPGSVAQR